jgi:hypothetical protein
MTLKEYGAAGMYPRSFRRTLCVHPQKLNKDFEKFVGAFMTNINKFPLSCENDS